MSKHLAKVGRKPLADPGPGRGSHLLPEVEGEGWDFIGIKQPGAADQIR